MSTRQNITIKQGSNFQMIVRWATKDVVFKAITGITRAAPPVITAVAHGLTDGWKAALTNIVGPDPLNALNDPPKTKDYYEVLVLTSDTFSLKGVDATGFDAYASGGIVRYFNPVDLSDYVSARMQVRSALAATSTILDLTSGAGDIVIDDTAKTITTSLDAADTELLSFSAGVYSMEMVHTSGAVYEVVHGKVTLDKEITR